jgi:hypothetical protein
LHSSDMNADFGGAVPSMRSTIITEGCLGSFPARLQIGSTQSMIFIDSEQGPFAVKGVIQTPSQQQQTKVPTATGRNKIRKLRKREILDLLLQHTGQSYETPFRNVNELHQICDNLNLQYKVEVAAVKEGWLGKPKGLFQILWERGWIDEGNIKKYVKDTRKEWLDGDGNLKQDEATMSNYKTYSLQYLLSECEDFKNERSFMEQLCHDLSARHGVSISILTSPKYHCEVAGDGIENGWGHAKKTYRRVPMKQKKTKEAFWKCAKDSLRNVSATTMRKFSAKARRYMLTYHLFDNAGEYADFETTGLAYKEIEKHVDTIMKVHRCSLDNDAGYISKVWRESQQQE